MTEVVFPFEKRRFRTAAPHYLQGRPPYAARLIARVAALTGLAAAHRVMDLGCGPGQLAHAFAPYAAQVVAIDPEPEMLRIARDQAPANVEFIEASSYDLSPHLGQFHLVTIGRAFHWMDRTDTLRRLDGLTDADGAVAFFSDSHLEPDIPGNRGSLRRGQGLFAPRRRLRADDRAAAGQCFQRAGDDLGDRAAGDDDGQAGGARIFAFHHLARKAGREIRGVRGGDTRRDGRDSS